MAMGAPFNWPLSKKAKVGISGAQRLVSKNSKPADEMRAPGPICPNRKRNGDAASGLCWSTNANLKPRHDARDSNRLSQLGADNLVDPVRISYDHFFYFLPHVAYYT